MALSPLLICLLPPFSFFITFFCLCHPPHFPSPPFCCLYVNSTSKARLRKGRLQPLSRPPWLLIFLLLVAVIAVSLSLLLLLAVICSAVPHAQSWHKQHTRLYSTNDTNKNPLLSGQVNGCLVENALLFCPSKSLEMQCQPESPKGRWGFFQKKKKIHKANCFCCSPPFLLFL